MSKDIRKIIYKVKRFSQFINENTLNDREEEIQQLIDIISMSPEKYGKYIKLLKSKYGIDFFDNYNDDIFIEDANLSDIKDKNDFLNFDNYIKYAKKIFSLRKIELPYDIDKTVKHSSVKRIGNLLGYKTKIKEYSGSGNYASFDLIGTITTPEVVDVNTLIHEIGHYFDYVYSNGYKGVAKKITFASSRYHIAKNNEVFAENFKHYFTAPDLLKNHLPDVYDELNNRIPQKYKTILNNLLE